ncbi:MAG: glycerophosphodiester phosphodiesterase family protein [Clostridia bacterium]|nr:glycerophosphodiester phosphodiesterase family protein [Clostridia bacterium]
MRTRTCFVFMLILLLLSSCAQSSPMPSDSTVPDSTAAPVPMIAFTADEPAYTIIYPEHLIGPLLDSARELYKTLRSETGSVSLDMTNDWLKAGTEGSPYEILIGQTNRPETAEVLRDLRYDDFAVRVVGDKLVIVGASDEKTVEAMAFFLENCVTAEGITLPRDYYVVVRGEYTYDEVLLGRVPLQAYRVVYSTAAREAAQTLVDNFGREFGCRLDTRTANDDEVSDFEIVLGSSSRKQLGSIGFYGYSISVEGNRIFINGYDTYAYEAAIATIRDALIAGNGKVSDLAALSTEYQLPDRAEYIKDPSLLYMRWALRDEVAPDWLLDYNARKAVLGEGANGRILTISHRADFQYYPENSIESIISCYYLGIDILELDIQPTKDNVLILMHDTTLTRMTDAADYIGKPGYPNSDKVSDWTLEQIKVLRLKEYQGGTNARLTEFGVPTLEEALIVAKDRMFIVPDKQDYWKYIDTDAVMASSGKAYLYTDMVKANNYESILISYRVTTVEGASIQKQIIERTGVTPLVYIRSTADSMEGNYMLGNKLCPAGTYLLQINGAFTPSDSTINSYVAAIAKVVSTTVGAWTIADDTDNIEVWQTMQDVGIDIIMTNHPHELVDFVIANHEK